MSTKEIAAIVVVVGVLVVVAVVAELVRRRRTASLKTGFGSEYDRTVQDAGTRSRAEKELRARQAEHEQLDLRSLTPAAQQRFTTAWQGLQGRFVDTPALALSEADTLVTQLLTERGYPVDDFGTRSRLLSVEHANVLESYRSAHQVEVASRAQAADTETVRNAFLDFRHVFEVVLSDATATGEPYPEGRPAPERERRSQP